MTSEDQNLRCPCGASLFEGTVWREGRWLCPRCGAVRHPVPRGWGGVGTPWPETWDEDWLPARWRGIPGWVPRWEWDEPYLIEGRGECVAFMTLIPIYVDPKSDYHVIIGADTPIWEDGLWAVPGDILSVAKEEVELCRSKTESPSSI